MRPGCTDYIVCEQSKYDLNFNYHSRQRGRLNYYSKYYLTFNYDATQ